MTSERVNAGIIDAIPDAILTIDAETEIIDCNRGAERMFGFTRNTVRGRRLVDVLALSHLRQRYDDDLRRNLSTPDFPPSGQRLQLQARHADGRLFPIELSLAEVPLADRRLFAACARDITEHERMQKALRESEQRFRSLAEVHPVPVGIVSIEAQRFLYVSPGLATLMRCTAEKLMTQDPAALFAVPAELDTLREQLQRTGAAEAYEFTLRKADGSTSPAGITAKRIVFQGISATVGAVMDLTERKHAEDEIARQREALHQSEKLTALGSLLAGVAHELNNPLSIVVGRAIMLEEENADSPIAAAAGKIRQAAERCTRIVKTFLAMARQQQPERDLVNLNTVITAAVDLVSYGLRTASVDVTLDLAPDLPELSADAVQFNQVFTNLIVNAQQALLDVPEPRRLHITTRHDRDDNMLRITLTDNGPGVPEQIRSRIFDPFFTTKTVGAGTGVGLSLSHGIITAHGGTLTLAPASGAGANFIITLPLVTAPPSEAREVRPTPDQAVSSMVLVVEDEPDLAELLSRILTRAGHRVDVAHSGNEALVRLAARDYEVILSDLHMPDLNGPDFYRHLQTSHPHVLDRVAFITGDMLGDVARRFLSEAKRPYLEKPVSPADVRRLVQQLLASTSPQEQQGDP